MRKSTPVLVSATVALLLSLTAFSVHAADLIPIDEAHFPDANFRAVLMSNANYYIERYTNGT